MRTSRTVTLFRYPRKGQNYSFNAFDRPGLAAIPQFIFGVMDTDLENIIQIVST